MSLPCTSLAARYPSATGQRELKPKPTSDLLLSTETKEGYQDERTLPQNYNDMPYAKAPHKAISGSQVGSPVASGESIIGHSPSGEEYSQKGSFLEARGGAGGGGVPDGAIGSTDQGDSLVARATSSHRHLADPPIAASNPLSAYTSGSTGKLCAYLGRM